MPTTYAIPDGRTVMAATTYTGTGSALTISNAVNGVSFQPDFVWFKNRASAYSHLLYDSIRGTSLYLSSNTTGAEVSYALGLTAFNSNGFSVGTDPASNESTKGIVAWQWKAGGTAVSNTSGTITSSVSANTTAGFSVVTYTGTGANATVGHGLGVAPSMIIVKDRGSVSNWNVYHTSLGNTQAVLLNSNAVPSTSAGFWNNTSPTSTVFSLGNGTSFTSGLAYCFAAVAGYSAFGNYTVNNSADGPFIYTGFRPRWILIRNTGASGWNWTIIDTSRNTYNVANASLYPDLSNAEGTANNIADILSNGFKIRSSWGNINTEGPVLYAAFAENPFKYANAR